MMSSRSPLNGLRILVTRSQHQAGELTSKFERLGAKVIEIPVIEIGPPDSWEPLDNALKQIDRYDWILFASVNAVEVLTTRMQVLGKTTGELAGIKLAAVGPATAQCLARHGLSAEFCPTKFIGEALASQFPGYPDLTGCRILWPRTNVGRDYLIEKLREAGAQVNVVPSYKTADPPDLDATAARLVTLLRERRLDVITLASAQSARNLGKLLALGLKSPESSLTVAVEKLLEAVTIATIGPETSKAAMQTLGRSDIEAREYTTEGLISALETYFATAQQ